VLVCQRNMRLRIPFIMSTDFLRLKSPPVPDAHAEGQFVRLKWNFMDSLLTKPLTGTARIIVAGWYLCIKLSMA